MIVGLIPSDTPQRDLNSSYKLRSRFWLGSVIGHILWVSIVVRIPIVSTASKRPIYDQFIRPLESKILVYRPPKKSAQAAPEKRVGDTPDPRGKIQAPQTIIATAPNAKSQKQIIWKPVNLPEIKTDVPAPTVVARVETALPPPPPKLAPKQFTPPPTAKADPKLANTEISATLTATPAVAVAQNNLPAPKAILPPAPKTAPKQFTPPPPSQREPKLATKTEINVTLAQPTPLAVAQNGPAVPTSTLPPPPKTAPKQFTPPPAKQASNAKAGAKAEVTETLASLSTVPGSQNSTAPPSITFSRLPGPPKDLPTAPVPTRGNEQANIAIASINPAAAAQVPTSSRSGQFSVAPATGEPSSGAAAPGSLTVPNLTVREPAPPKAQGAKSNTVVYAEKVRASNSTTFTVPLRPSNRSIPRTVGEQFPGRTVYAIVIPIENLPAYNGDWILWFSETAPPAGQTPSIRAPMPFRKLEFVERARETTDTRLQISAKLGSNGKLTDVKILSTVSATVQALALEDLTSWEWKPATRSGVAVAIDAVFEIPFRLGIRP